MSLTVTNGIRVILVLLDSSAFSYDFLKRLACSKTGLKKLLTSQGVRAVACREGIEYSSYIWCICAVICSLTCVYIELVECGFDLGS